MPSVYSLSPNPWYVPPLHLIFFLPSFRSTGDGIPLPSPPPLHRRRPHPVALHLFRRHSVSPPDEQTLIQLCLIVGQLTDCNKCELPQGQLCVDCLYTRYGENVKEANFNPKWTCLSCREICNCNSCRRKNGWMPTGNIYNKVTKLGFKSVAHYLIKTRRSEESMEGSGAKNIVAQEIPETSPDSTLIRTLTRPIRTRRALRS